MSREERRESQVDDDTVMYSSLATNCPTPLPTCLLSRISHQSLLVLSFRGEAWTLTNTSFHCRSTNHLPIHFSNDRNLTPILFSSGRDLQPIHFSSDRALPPNYFQVIGNYHISSLQVIRLVYLSTF